MDSAGTFSVLIVEDNDDAAESLATVFRMYGHDARTASCGETALRLAREARPDAVVLDLGLPGMDGFAVAGELLALAPPRPLLIAVSGHTGLRTECLAAGIDYYLHKPADPAVLGALIHAHSAAASESRAGGGGVNPSTGRNNSGSVRVRRAVCRNTPSPSGPRTRTNGLGQ